MSQTQAADDLTGFTYEKEMRRLIEFGVINGYEDGTYKPNRNVTRAEFAKMIVLTFDLPLFGESPDGSVSTAQTTSFTDVNQLHWFSQYVETASQAGIINGFPDGTFQPNTLISREQVATMVSRALQFKGVYIDPASVNELKFTDRDSVLPIHRPDVQLLTHLAIINGNTNNTYRPKEVSTRWMVSLILLRAYDYLTMSPDNPYKVMAVTNGVSSAIRQYSTYDDAVEFATRTQQASYIENNSQIEWMKDGLVVSKGLVEIYPTPDLRYLSSTKRLEQYRPYVTTNSELEHMATEKSYVQVQIAGKIGYVKKAEVRLIPEGLLSGKSYYQKSGTTLRHYFYNHTTNQVTTSIEVGTAPSALRDNTKYYSDDGATFYTESGDFVTTAHQYFNKMHLRSKTKYTAQELDRFLNDQFPYYNKLASGVVWKTSPLAGSGQYFKDIEAQYDVNALYLMAHAIHESAWGTSKIAQDKRNLFGYGAIDSDPYRGAYTYVTFKESIEDAAKRVTATYQHPTASFYNGSFLGNKGLGMNVRYASDPYWGEKIAGFMFRADQYLGKKDYQQQTLGTVNSGNSALNFRSGAATTFPLLYSLAENGLIVSIKGTPTPSWYTVTSEDRAFSDAFVHSSYIQQLPLAP